MPRRVAALLELLEEELKFPEVEPTLLTVMGELELLVTRFVAAVSMLLSVPANVPVQEETLRTQDSIPFARSNRSVCSAEVRVEPEMIVPFSGLMILDISPLKLVRAELEPEMVDPFKVRPAAAAA